MRLIVTLLIFTSPAELGLATPMVMIAAIARAARSGILVKGGVHLEALAKIDAMVFDKTGTLTVGQTESSDRAVVTRWHENELLRLAAAADRRSGHPLAKAVVEYAAKAGIEVPEPEEFEVIPGRGVKATVDGRTVLVGNKSLLNETASDPPPARSGEAGTRRCMSRSMAARSGGFTSRIRFGPEHAKRSPNCEASGVKHVVMLTGDNSAVAMPSRGARGGRSAGRTAARGEGAGDRGTEAAGARVAMVGDGVNDAPALARADVGIAMGAGGTQAALEAADIALMTDDLSRILLARAIARRAYRTIQENIFVGVGVVHVLGITAALLGWIGPIQAAMLHLGPDILVFVNSIKLLRVRLE